MWGVNSLLWQIVNIQLKNQDNITPPKCILALPTQGLTCLVFELFTSFQRVKSRYKEQLTHRIIDKVVLHIIET